VVKCSINWSSSTFVSIKKDMFVDEVVLIDFKDWKGNVEL
jgi:hypothetical protein